MTDALRLLRELVMVPSVTGTDGEKQAVEWLARQLAPLHIQPEYVGLPERPNLIARIKGSNPALRPLVLLSHLDVAPVEASRWRHPPFGGVVAQGRLYGRGTLDTKQLAVMELIAFKRLCALPSLPRDVVLIATVDEEQGSKAGAELVARQQPEWFRRSIVLSEGGGFPLSVQGKPYITLVVGEKAACRIRLTAKGQAGHAAAPGDDQAVVKLMAAVAAILEGIASLPPDGPVFHAMEALLGQSPALPLAAELLNYAGHHGVNVAPFTVGEKVNVLPAQASLTMELRLLPGITQAQVEQWLQVWLESHSVACETEWFQPGNLCPPGSSLLRSLMAKTEQAAAAAGLAAQVLPMLALGRTDGRFFTGDSAVFGFSPLGMDDTFDHILPMVHGDNESVSLSGFALGCDVFTELAMFLTTEVED